MADNYMQFCDALELDDAKQVAWFKKQLDPGMLERLREYELEHSGLKIRKPKWANGIVLAAHILGGSDAAFNYNIEGPDAKQRYSIVFYNEDCGDADAVAVLVQAYLKKFAPKRCFGICWAATCSKSRVGEFGGGAMFVTANAIEYLNTFEWLDRKVAAFKQPPAPPPAFAPHEIGSIYCEPKDRFVVSLIASYDTRRDRKRTPQQALAAALRLTTDDNSFDTLWHVFDRKTKELHQVLQQEAT